MANYRAISNGNASDLARWEVWNGSVWVAAAALPTAMDDVYANGFTVTLDVDFYAASYRTTGIAGVAASGGFILNGGVTAMGDVLSGGSICMTHSAASDSYVVGDSFGAAGQPSNSGTDGIRGTGTGTVHLVGSCQNGTGTANSTANSPTGIRSTGSGSFIVYGNAVAISNGNQQGVAAYAHVSSGRVVGRAIGVNSGNCFGAINCEVNELEGRNSSCTVTGKFIVRPTPDWFNCVAKAGAAVLVEIYDESGNAITLNPIAAQGQAAPADVRSGTSYANGALEGTCAIPPAGSVSLGVPVDATTGTGSVTSAEIRDLILPSILSAITQP